MVICLEPGAIQIGFAFLVPAHPGSPEKRAVKRVCVCVVIAKFHYTGPTGPARTLSETRTDKTEFRRKKVRVGPCRARVVEFSSSPTMCVDFFWSGPVGPV